MERWFRISANYIEWAFGPGAESGHTKATELCSIIDRSDSPYILIHENRRDLIEEVASVAELYVGGHDNDLRSARVLFRARKFLKETS